MTYFLSYCKRHCSAVLSQYQTLRKEGLLCDILLKVKENEFPAHKSLLACSSDYFKAMFKSYTQESKAAIVHLQVISAIGLQHVLDFIYTSWLPLSFTTLEDTLEAATYLQVPEAICLCSQYLAVELACRAILETAREQPTALGLPMCTQSATMTRPHPPQPHKGK
uniref:BTB domain-containing protein n=1 Tax=Naja naja TaxID=35670 RepID=A0A8C6XKU7_NAJNA